MLFTLKYHIMCCAKKEEEDIHVTILRVSPAKSSKTNMKSQCQDTVLEYWHESAPYPPYHVMKTF